LPPACSWQIQLLFIKVTAEEKSSPVQVTVTAPSNQL
jgi:hypothetical protein